MPDTNWRDGSIDRSCVRVRAFVYWLVGWLVDHFCGQFVIQ